MFTSYSIKEFNSFDIIIIIIIIITITFDSELSNNFANKHNWHCLNYSFTKNSKIAYVATIMSSCINS